MIIRIDKDTINVLKEILKELSNDYQKSNDSYAYKE
jgi:hypothetical protein